MTIPFSNPSFDVNLAGWSSQGTPTLSWVAGTMRVQAPGSGSGGRQSIGEVVSGTPYDFRYQVPNYVSGQFSAYMLVGANAVYGDIHSATGEFSDTLIAPLDGEAYLGVLARAGAAEFFLDNMGVKQAMALASVGYNLTVILVDSGGNQSNLRYELTAADATTAATDAAAIVAALNLVTNAVIKGYTLGHRYEEDAFSYPAGGIHVEDRATVVVGLTTSPSKRATINIPAPVDGLFLSATGDGYNRVDPADADLQSYVAIYGTGNEATISDGENVDTALANGGIIEGRRTHRQASYG